MLEFRSLKEKTMQGRPFEPKLTVLAARERTIQLGGKILNGVLLMEDKPNTS